MYDELFSAYIDADDKVVKSENERDDAVINIVRAIQGDNDYVEFTDPYDKPQFYNECVEEWETIMGAKVEDDELYLITTDGDFNDEKTWFRWRDYGTMSLSDFIYMEQQTGSKLGEEYVKAVYCHPAYLTYMQSTS